MTPKYSQRFGKLMRDPTGQPQVTPPSTEWHQKKFEGRFVCAVCGDFIRTKKGDKAVRHEKKTIRLGINRKETFYTMKHRGKCPK